MPLIANCSASLAAATCSILYRSESLDAETSRERPGGKPIEAGLSSNAKYNIVTAYEPQSSVGIDSNMRDSSRLAEQKLLWGELSANGGRATDDHVGHAGFSAEAVGKIQIGHLYA